MDNNYLENVNQKLEAEVSKIYKWNEYTSKYGLQLTDNEIRDIVQKKEEVLKDTNRIEFRKSIIEEIIQAFCDSPYIFKDNYAQTIYELIDIFYTYKNETLDIVTDGEFLEFMKDSFNGVCQGDLDYLSGTILYKMKNNVLDGKPMDWEEETFE